MCLPLSKRLRQRERKKERVREKSGKVPAETLLLHCFSTEFDRTSQRIPDKQKKNVPDSSPKADGEEKQQGNPAKPGRRREPDAGSAAPLLSQCRSAPVIHRVRSYLSAPLLVLHLCLCVSVSPLLCGSCERRWPFMELLPSPPLLAAAECSLLAAPGSRACQGAAGMRDGSQSLPHRRTGRQCGRVYSAAGTAAKPEPSRASFCGSPEPFRRCTSPA